MKEEAPHYVVYGGQYGSEGKASAAEFWANRLKADKHELMIIGENSPNSGHTSSKGATKNIPASSFWADLVVLGPDAVVDPEILLRDWELVGRKPLYIHENAALLIPECKGQEADLVSRISSTGSGSGMARSRKFINRFQDSVVRDYKFPDGIEVLSRDAYMDLFREHSYTAKIMECSQGALLDTNFGVFPYVTSRSTLPRVAVERNGLGHLPWQFAGVYRTYPIRTGGPSGPTGGDELEWRYLGVPAEIATVTKRTRRVFEFSTKDFCRSLALTRPDHIMFTFLDYLGVSDLSDIRDFEEWLSFYDIDEVKRMPVWASNKTGQFVWVP